jgi:integrase
MWQRIGKTIELYGATPHVFRHTYLSILASSGVDPKTIQTLAGHADFSFTFNKYIDKDSKNIKNAAVIFENHINGTKNGTLSKTS